jgi:hypothetical protein
MARVEVSWEERNGTSYDGPALMEDRSESGACIRTNIPVRVGSEVNVKWHREEFSGIARYCRSDTGAYVSGIQRYTKQPRPIQSDTLRDGTTGNIHLPSIVEIQNEPKHLIEVHGIGLESETKPIIPDANSPLGLPRQPDHEANCEDHLLVSMSQRSEAPKGTDFHAQQPSIQGERKDMSAKWLDAALGRQKQDAPNGKANSTPVPEDPTPAEAAPAAKIRANASVKDLPRFNGDLQSIEDIYRAAGIMNPRMGYSISKVSEMLNSDHIRGLSTEAKRAAVLMALEAAGISIDEVLRDARVRQDAIDTYEAKQRRRFEEYWTRKDNGNAQIQAEMERATAQCLDLIKRNLDEVASEKAAFAGWQAMKEQEIERISDVRELCSKPSPPAELPGSSLLAVRSTGAIVKPS